MDGSGTPRRPKEKVAFADVARETPPRKSSRKSTSAERRASRNAPSVMDSPSAPRGKGKGSSKTLSQLEL